MAHFRRARWGVRRTFQTEQAIEELSVYDNVAMIHEHSKLSGGSRRAGRARRDRVRRPRGGPGSQGGDARRRRAAPGRGRARGRRAPPLVLLDEPAAGLPDAETAHLGGVIRGDPRAHRGADHPRRPRHGPRLVLLRGDRGARLRQADRLRPNRRGAARRARGPRVPRQSRSVSHERRAALCLDRASSSRAAAVRSSATSRWRSSPARSPRCSDPTARASRAWCWRSAACSRPRAGSVKLGERELAGRRPEEIRHGRRGDRARGPAAAARADRRGQHQGGDLRAVRAARPRRVAHARSSCSPSSRSDSRNPARACRAASSRWSCSPRRSSPSRST